MQLQRGHATLLRIISVLQLIRFALAFNPSYLLVGGFPYEGLRKIIQDDPTHGLLGRPHAGITQDAINRVYPKYFNLDRPTSTMKKARREIEVGAEKVDDHGDHLKEAEESECHFDDENFQASNQRLIDKKTEVVESLAANDVSHAREYLGRALHTLQDFYSHSNWVELGNTDASQISQKLGVVWPLDIPVVAEDPKSDTTRTCTACQYSLAAREGAILSADVCREVFGRIPFNDPMAGIEKTLTTLCMLGITSPVDFELQAALLLTGISVPVITPVEWPNCRSPSNLLPLGDRLTSGWFGALPKTHATRKEGKCSHGGPFDRDADGLEGISKDTANPFFTPHWFNHYTAAALAEAATVKYLNELADMLCKSATGATIAYKDCVPLRKLYGVGPPLAFAIDTTGSMGSIIASVRRDAIAMVQSRVDSENLPGYYVLSEIQDPAPTNASIYYDSASFIEAINRLSAFGGDDCPEFAMAGISNALDLMGPGGTIHLWTDAAAKDSSISQAVTRRLQQQGTALYSYLFQSGICPTSETFDFVSEGSGGQFFPGLSPLDASGTSALVKNLALEDRVDIWTVIVDFFSFSRRQAGTPAHTYDIPVDSNMTTLTLSVSGSSLKIYLHRPDGSSVQAGDAGVEITTLSTGIIFSISPPVSGIWKVSVDATSGFSMSVFGTSTLQFDRFDFLEYASGHHDGFFPVKKQPSVGDSGLGYCVLDGGFASAEFEIRTLDGSSLRTLNFTGGSGAEGDLPAEHFYGNIPIPSVGFNVYVTGKDATGAPYQRVLPGISKPTASNSTNSTLPTNTTMPRSFSTTQTSISGTPVSSSTNLTALYSTASAKPYPSANGSYPVSSPTFSTSCSGQVLATETPVTTLTQTVIYNSLCPVEEASKVSYSTATITTTIEVPCYSKCHVPLPTLSPGCKGSGSSGSGYTTSAHAAALYSTTVHSETVHSSKVHSGVDESAAVRSTAIHSEASHSVAVQPTPFSTALYTTAGGESHPGTEDEIVKFSAPSGSEAIKSPSTSAYPHPSGSPSTPATNSSSVPDSSPPTAVYAPVSGAAKPTGTSPTSYPAANSTTVYTPTVSVFKGSAGEPRGALQACVIALALMGLGFWMQ